MGKAVARVGDFVKSDADWHPFSYPVPVVGIITAGSSNVYCNDRPVAIADATKKSAHVVCAGPNQFSVRTGSDKVYANNFPVGRDGDSTDHCGSNGGIPPGAYGSILPFCSLNTFA